MAVKNFQAEVHWGTEAVGLTFEGLDLVVHTFELTGQNRMYLFYPLKTVGLRIELWKQVRKV